VTIFPYGNLLADEHLVDPSRRTLDEELFRRLGVRPGEYLLSVARLAPPKCPEDILAAFATVRSAGFGVDLVYAGEGPMRNQLAAEAAALGLADHVHFIGNQNQRSLAQLNAHAAAVLSPLTGRALSESALGAAPIVAYDLDWQGDLIHTGETGELFPWHALAKRRLALPSPTRDLIDPYWTDAGFLLALERFGYDVTDEQKAVIAFQRRFRPDLIDGIVDGECRAKLLALLLPRPQ
jgi:glycosyltransferase involved in cell wall biosynthesis